MSRRMWWLADHLSPGPRLCHCLTHSAGKAGYRPKVWAVVSKHWWGFSVAIFLLCCLKAGAWGTTHSMHGTPESWDILVHSQPILAQRWGLQDLGRYISTSRTYQIVSVYHRPFWFGLGMGLGKQIFVVVVYAHPQYWRPSQCPWKTRD